MRVRIQRYRRGSSSAAALKKAMNDMWYEETLFLNTRESSFVCSPLDKVLNWGSTEDRGYVGYLNQPTSVALAKDKAIAFVGLSEEAVDIPAATMFYDIAHSWVMGGYRVYERHTVTGMGGSGIRIADAANTLIQAPLYTLATHADKEYRVHVYKGEVIDVQQKRRRISAAEEDTINEDVRTHANGWVFCRRKGNGALISPPACVIANAIKAVAALGLDYGAVDVGYRTHTEEAFVYEVNTAPGLTPSTAKAYATAIGKDLGLTSRETGIEMEYVSFDEEPLVNYEDRRGV